MTFFNKTPPIYFFAKINIIINNILFSWKCQVHFEFDLKYKKNKTIKEEVHRKN